MLKVYKVGATSYEIIEELGQGGMGIVYRAKDLDSGKSVALKTINSVSERRLAGLRREILYLQGLQHPGIIQIIDQGVIDDTPWYAMEYITGTTLRDAFQLDRDMAQISWWTNSLSSEKGILNSSMDIQRLMDKRRKKSRQYPAGYQDQVYQVMQNLCTPLAFLHTRGLVHRDLKPCNIMIRDNGLPIIMDFGLTTGFSGARHREFLDGFGRGMGTLEYMAPEQIIGENVDARADMFSLGCVMYELLTGIPPFHGMGCQWKNRGASSIKPPSHYKDGIPQKIDDSVMRLLAEKPVNRLSYATELAEILSQVTNATTNTVYGTPNYLHRPRFSGRKNSVKQLDELLVNSLIYKGSSIFLGGQSGIGKTRFAQEIKELASHHSFRVIVSNCMPARIFSSHKSIQGGGPLHAFISILESIADTCKEKGLEECNRVFGADGPLLRPYMPGIRDLPGQSELSDLPDLLSQENRLRLFRGISKIFINICKHQPLLIILDDFHWADDVSVNLLNYFIEKQICTKGMLSFLITYRTEEITESLENLKKMEQVHNLYLEPLTTSEIESIVSDMLSTTSVSPALMDSVVKIASGIPFFAGAFLQYCLDSGNLFFQQGKWSFEAPEKGVADSLESLILLRLNNLDKPMRQIMDYLSVSRIPPHLPLLGKLMNMDESSLARILNELILKQLVIEDYIHRYHPFHSKIREYNESQLSDNRKKKLHSKLADVIESEFPEIQREMPTELAYHLETAGKKEQAAKQYVCATKKAIEQFDFERAEQLFNKAISLIKPDTRLHIQTRMGRIANVLNPWGKLDEALAESKTLMNPLEKLGDKYIIAKHYEDRMSTYLRQGNSPEAELIAKQALEIYQDIGDSLSKAHILGNLGIIFARKGQFEQAVEYYSRSAELYKKQGDKVLESWVLANLALAYFSLGQSEKKVQNLNQAMEIAKEIGHLQQQARIYGFWSVIHTNEGNLDMAMDCKQQNLALLRELGDRGREGAELLGLASIQMQLCLFEEAAKNIEISHEICSEYSNCYSIACYHQIRGLLLYYQCKFQESLKESKKACELFEDFSYISPLYETRLNHGITLAYCGEYEEALTAFQQSGDIAGQSHSVHTQISCLAYSAEVHAAIGQIDEVENCVSRIYELIQASVEILYTQSMLIRVALTLYEIGKTTAAQDLIKEFKLDEYRTKVINPYQVTDALCLIRLRRIMKLEPAIDIQDLMFAYQNSIPLVKIEIIIESAFENIDAGNKLEMPVSEIMELAEKLNIPGKGFLGKKLESLQKAEFKLVK